MKDDRADGLDLDVFDTLLLGVFADESSRRLRDGQPVALAVRVEDEDLYFGRP